MAAVHLAPASALENHPRCTALLSTTAALRAACLTSLSCTLLSYMQAMGLEGGSDGVVSAADINADSFEQALTASPALFVDTYRQRGKQLSFAADK